MTETESRLRVDLIRSNLRAALVEAGAPAPLAATVVAGASVSSFEGGSLVELGGLRAIDTTESLAALAGRLVRGDAPGVPGSVSDTAGNAAARAEGKAMAERAKQAEADRERCFR